MRLQAPEQCFRHDPVGHVLPGYTREQLAGLLIGNGCQLQEARYFMIEATGLKLGRVGRLGVLRGLVPLAWMDAEKHLFPEGRELAYPMGMVCLFKKA